MIACLLKARLDDGALVAQALFGPAQRGGQLAQVVTADSAELDALEGVPDALVGGEFRGVAGQLLPVQALGRAARQEVLDRLAAMNGRTVPDEEQLALQLALQLAQEPPQEANPIRGAVGVVLGLQEPAPVRAGVMPLIAARWSWVSGTRKRGVCPPGAHVRTAWGSKYKPD
jgi:hypothetical protein